MSDALPIAATAEGASVMHAPSSSWPTTCGRTVADAAALLFPLTLTDDVLALFHDAIRQEVAAEMLGRDVDENFSSTFTCLWGEMYAASVQGF